MKSMDSQVITHLYIDAYFDIYFKGYYHMHDELKVETLFISLMVGDILQYIVNMCEIENTFLSNDRCIKN